MSNFRIPRSGKDRNGSLDGFITNRSSQPVSRRFLHAHKPEPRPNNAAAASFNRPDGFYSSGLSQPAQARSTLSAVPRVTTYESERPRKERETKHRSWLRRKNKEKKHRSRPAKVLRSVGILGLLLILVVGGILGYGYLKARNIFKGEGNLAAALQENVDPSQLRVEGDGRINILILGKGGPTQSDGPELTDTILLASIDPVQNEAALLSVPRDLWVKDSSGRATKINEVYVNAKNRFKNESRQNAKDEDGAEKAGTDEIMAEVSEVLGIPMHYYVMVNFTAFEKAINTVGGITINVKNPVSEQMLLNGKPYRLNVGTGTQTFDGLRALAYARCRHCDNRSDFGRTERQREIIIALKDKVLSTGTLANPVKLYQLMSTFGDNIRTSLGGLDEVTRLFEIGKKIGSDKIKSYGLADEPQKLVTTGTMNGLSVVLPRAGTFEYDEIHNFVRNNIRDSYLKSEDANVIVLNGTNIAGLAANTSEELRSYGYKVGAVGDAPTKDYVNTYLIDMTNGAKKYTKHYLEKRLGVTATTQITDAAIDATGADFVIIVGQNEANRQED